MNRTSTYKPGLARFAAIGSAWVFVLVTLGAFTTSIGAGMAFPDWPLSNGSVNPTGWLEDVAMFAEHSHRLSGTLMGLLTIGLAVWLWRTEERSWMRRLGWWSLAIVVVQGAIGGKRVLLDQVGVPGFDMTLGQMLRIPHGILAQAFVCLLFAIAVGLSRSWIDRRCDLTGSVTGLVRRVGLWCLALVALQLVVAATMRHNHAGLAMPTFPLTPEGGLLPANWDFRVAIHFAHRLLAVAITVAIAYFGHVLWRDAAISRPIRGLWIGIAGLLVGQIYLGAQIIWTGRNAYMTTAHVCVGALTLAATFVLVMLTHRDSFGPTKTT